MNNQIDASNNSYNNDNNNNNSNNGKSGSNKVLLWIILGILIGAIICAGGAYYYINNIEDKECESEKVDNNKDKEVNGEVEVTDEMFNSLLLYKIDDQISIDPNIIADMKAGKSSDWTDFEKVFFALNSIVNDNSYYSCPDDNYDVCIPKYMLDERVAQIFGDSVTVKSEDFAEFKKYPFDPVTNDIARYDSSSEDYVIDNLLAGHGGGKYDYYKSVVYKITNDNDKYKVYYALLYVVPGEDNCFDICGPHVDTYKYYTDSSMKTLVYEDTGDNKKVDFTSSEYLSKLNKRIITYIIDKDMKYFTIANLETE